MIEAEVYRNLFSHQHTIFSEFVLFNSPVTGSL